MVTAPLRYLVSHREYEAIRSFLALDADRPIERRVPSDDSSKLRHDHNAATIRSASRVFIATTAVLKTYDIVLPQITRRLARRATTSPRLRKPLVASTSRFALSLASILLLHRLLFRFFSRLRTQLLHEKVTSIRERYPRLVAALTTRLTPAVGASLAGLALGICPSDQMRLSIVIYVGARSLEFLYNAADASGYLKHKPAWMGSWLLFALGQGQLLHAFVFDPDCFPHALGDFILQYTPTYLQARPKNISSKVTWPRSRDIVDSLADMARLNWPPFVSPILHPGNTATLPAGINPIISPLTSRAHPAMQHLSCALIHPSDLSCFRTYLKQNLMAFPVMARFFALYYGAFAVLRYKQFYQAPLASINRLSSQIIRTTVAIAGAIGTSWASICLFAAIFPRSFLPRFRFFLGGFLGGLWQYFDQGSAGRTNSMYSARLSADSLWKVGVKHAWWKPVRGADVYLFVAAIAIVNIVFQQRAENVDSSLARWLVKLLRGETDLELSDRRPKGAQHRTEDGEKASGT